MTTNHPKLTLSDTMILVATTGLSLSIYITLDKGLFNGERHLFVFGMRPVPGWETLYRTNQACGALSLLLILFGGWTVTLPLLIQRKSPSDWRRLSRRPGISGCIAATAGMLVWSVVAIVTYLLRNYLEDFAPLPVDFWVQSPIFDLLLVCSGMSVAAEWLAEILTGRWRPMANIFDRLGRGISILWLVVGMTFTARMILK